MVEKIVNHIVKNQISLGKISKEESGVYQYGYTLFFEKLINIIIVIGICVITDRWLEIWSFLLVIIPLRSYAGGWHASKFWKCAIISNLIVVSMLMVTGIINITNDIFYLCMEIIILIIMLFIIPTQNVNKPLTSAECKEYKKKTIFIWVIQGCLILIFVIYKKYTYSLAILYAHIIVITATIAEKICEKKRTMRDEVNAIY